MPSPSTRIGRYEIKNPIGGGGMGTLYLARDPNTGRLVALKLLRAHLDSDELKARFAREAQALASLNHPNIVDIYDSGQYRGSPFMVMEYVRGETIAEKIKRNVPLTLSQKLKLVAELCAGLGHAHESGVIHRDIKPANLMVEDRYRRLKIVDFGIARVTEGLTRLGVQMTQLHMQIGTPGYMSPEQIEGAEIDHRSDLFAVGAVLYEILSYREAFPGANTRQIERKVLQEQPQPLVSLIPGLDPTLQDIVDKALQKDANDRFQSAAEFEEALERQRERVGTGDTPVPATKPTPAPGAQAGVKLSKAEAAYQRCLEVYADGAVDTAKRFALESLAEDPNHAGARELLAKVDPQRWAPPPTSGDHGTEIAGTAVSRQTGHEPTMIAGAGPTKLSTNAGGASPWAPQGQEWPSEQSDWSPDQDGWSSDQDETIVVPQKKASRRGTTRREEVVPEKRFPILAAVGLSGGAVALVAIAIGITIYLMRPWDRGYELTILKPEGGTLTTTGLTCGSGGNACSTSFEEGRVLEFEAKPDEGFAFAGYTGDCAPGGRTMMTGPRSCGATFVATAKPAEPGRSTLLLTVTPVAGGTIVGSGINCGTKGKDCTVQHPEGATIQLAAMADPGYRAGSFVGDCAPKGTAVMARPLTCGATFLPTTPLAKKGEKPGDTIASNPGTKTGPGGPGSGPGSVPGGPGSQQAGNSGGTGSGSGGSGGRDDDGPSTKPATKEEPVKPPISADAHARSEIEKTLRAYNTAYQDLNYEAIQRVHPSAQSILRRQLSQYEQLDQSYAGPFEFKDLDPESGRAIVEVGVKRVITPKVGQKIEDESRVRFSLHKRLDDWLIDQVTFQPKKK